ncbi:AraC family transcriptional regulator [Pandoraea terrae]|uniref:AraC family transcriptional regulator n=2 Tax=Pandoraea terrae TaxID=1537710 RepID=A0A5E4U2N0_9BURK|nr:AraC family transcriptional regulator [Pandoraea terrae]
MQAMAVPPVKTVPICFLRSAVRHAAARGDDVQALLRAIEIDPALLEDDNARVPLTRYAALHVAAARAMNDESLGYAALPSKVGTWQMACLSSVHPGPIGHALGRMCKFYRVLERGLSPQLVVEGDDALIEIVGPDSDPLRDLYAYEMTFVVMWRFVSWLLKRPLQLISVTLPHDAPHHLAEYRWMFPGAEVSFRKPRAALRFDRSILDLPVRRDERELHQLLLNDVGEILVGMTDTATWADRIRTLLTSKLPWLPEFEQVAAQFSIHPQTLRRRLAHEGLAFSTIKDQVRCEAAKYYLEKQALSIEEVAYRSGFSEASSLIRAFHRWTGMTPCTYAQSQRTRSVSAQQGALAAAARAAPNTVSAAFLTG